MKFDSIENKYITHKFVIKELFEHIYFNNLNDEQCLKDINKLLDYKFRYYYSIRDHKGNKKYKKYKKVEYIYRLQHKQQPDIINYKLDFSKYHGSKSFVVTLSYDEVLDDINTFNIQKYAITVKDSRIIKMREI